MRKNKKYSLKNIILIIIGIGLLFTGAIAVWVSTLQLPDFKNFTEKKLQSSTKIYDRTGQILLYDVNQGIKRTVIPYEDMGTNIKNATVAIEDSEFYNHKGIRISSIIRATVWAKITGRKMQGGSTITQQLIKNTLLTQEVSISRKVKEWILAIRLEKIMSKEEIFGLYLNEAPYGGSIYGIKEASNVFFNKEPMDLTLAEAAYLAAIPNGPTYFSPYGKNVDKLENRKNLVLSRMLDLGFIDKKQYENAKTEKVIFQPQKYSNITAPHFVFFVKDYLEKKYGENALTESGLKVTTTIDYNIQKEAEKIALFRAHENEKSWNGSNTAIVVIDPKTGQILAMVGSRDYFDKSIDGNFNVATSPRQPGSSFKPIVYALAFEKGFTDKTVLFDVRTEFNSSCDKNGLSKDAKCYSPDNYDNAFRGPMTLRNALAQSINVIAVKLLYLVGLDDSIKMARALGVETLKNDPDRYGLSLVIGGGETSLLDMTSAYGVFANEGIRNPYASILKVEDINGNILEEFKKDEKQVLSSNSARIISSILSDNIARTPTFGANSALKITDREVAVKTGTTNDNKDAWTIGYTPSYSVGVWVGNNDNKPMKKGGVALAGPIWNDVMSFVLKDSPSESFNKPNEIDPSIPPVLRGYWQGGETFVIDNQSKGLATEFTPYENREEKSITNVHTILYWINKNNVLEKNKGLTNDPQFKNWEYGVLNWWENNKNKYPLIKESDRPSFFDNIHTKENKPSIDIFGLENNTFKKEDVFNISVTNKKTNPLKKVDVFVNNEYVSTTKNDTFNLVIDLKNINNLKQSNTIKIIGYDIYGNRDEKSFEFEITNL